MEGADAIVIGAGPAGASCAIWLRQTGFRPLLVDRQPTAGGLTNDSPYLNNWIAGLNEIRGTDYGDAIHRQLAGLDIVRIFSASGVVARKFDSGFEVSGRTEAGRRPFGCRAPFLVLATGTEPQNGGLTPSENVYVGPGRRMHDADFSDLDTAILGGGDNAFENFSFVRDAGARRIRLFARTVLARPSLVATVPRDAVFRGDYTVDEQNLCVNGERFDRLLVFYGWRPHNRIAGELGANLDEKGYIRTDFQTAETSIAGLFAIGDVAARAHPCCATAMADGVVAARAIQQRLEETPGHGPPP